MKKVAFLFVLKLGIAVALFGIIFSAVDWRALQDNVARISLLTSAGLVLLILLQTFLLAVRWSAVTRISGHRLPFVSSFSGILASFFFAQGLPSSIGGDALRVWWLRRNQIPLSDAAKSVLFDRIVGLLSLLLVCVASLILLATRTDQDAFGYLGNAITISVVVGLGGAVVLMLPRRLGISGAALSWAERLPELAARAIRWAVEFREMFLGAKSTRTGSALIAALGVLVHFLTVMLAYLVALDINAGLSFLDCLAVVAPSLLVSYLPISIAGWGVREASMVVAFGLIGVPVEVSLLISLIIGFTVLAVSLIGGAVWVLSGGRQAYRHVPTTPETSKGRA